jgi:hypothetical protein
MWFECVPAKDAVLKFNPYFEVVREYKPNLYIVSRGEALGVD